jgi:hypothetical protein
LVSLAWNPLIPKERSPARRPLDDWTPWATTESEGDDASSESEGDGDASEATTTTPVASARAQRLAQGESTGTASTRGSRRRVGGAAVPVPAAHIRAPVSVGGIIAVVGAIVAGGGTLLEMVKVGLGPNNLTTTTLSTTYFDTDNGKIAALGAVALVLALATLVRPVANFIPSIVVAACGLAAFGLALSDRLDLSNAGDDYRREFFRDNQLRGLVQVTIGPALYVAMAGGLIATIGAVLASRDRWRSAIAGDAGLLATRDC